MITTPRSLRLQVGIFGTRNAGKSSLLNAIARQQVSIVSPHPGTTTDPVEKPMEMLPLGPVVFIDTAGVDDEGELGRVRVERARAIMGRCDVAIVVAAEGIWSGYDEELCTEFAARSIPTIVVFNKADLTPPSPELVERVAARVACVVVAVASQGKGVSELHEALVAAAPEPVVAAPPLLADLVAPGDLAVLVVPIDMEAPKGRLILPQVQTIRELLDLDAYCLVVKERELRAAFSRINSPPALVVTDSQAFLRVVADTPADVPLTSFSILFARAKGDLLTFVEGAAAIDRLRAGDRILIAEACSHHPVGDDIGRVKIPRWLTQYVGGKLEIDHVQGHSFPLDLAPYRLVVHCGACTLNRRAVLTRVARCREQRVPVTNYGMCIAYSLGIFARALRPFPAARALLDSWPPR
ncbi:MAG: [FeFe] hydrogenase H-cluster maturation GTPase HydF [Polyangiaceae bacterium]